MESKWFSETLPSQANFQTLRQARYVHDTTCKAETHLRASNFQIGPHERTPLIM
jgi:hypothetical protein